MSKSILPLMESKSTETKYITKYIKIQSYSKVVKGRRKVTKCHREAVKRVSNSNENKEVKRLKKKLFCDSYLKEDMFRPHLSAAIWPFIDECRQEVEGTNVSGVDVLSVWDLLTANLLAHQCGNKSLEHEQRIEF